MLNPRIPKRNTRSVSGGQPTFEQIKTSFLALLQELKDL
jgi:hypothetical protein